MISLGFFWLGHSRILREKVEYKSFTWSVEYWVKESESVVIRRSLESN